MCSGSASGLWALPEWQGLPRSMDSPGPPSLMWTGGERAREKLLKRAAHGRYECPGRGTRRGSQGTLSGASGPTSLGSNPARERSRARGMEERAASYAETRSQERCNPRKTQEQVRRSVARLWSYGISAFGAANGERRSKAVRKGRLCSCPADAKVVKTLRSMSVAVGHDKTCSKNCRKNASTARNRANSRWQNTLERD